MADYLQTKNNDIYYRRRVPSALKSYFMKQNELFIPIINSNKIGIKKEAEAITQNINKAIYIVGIDGLSIETKGKAVAELLKIDTEVDPIEEDIGIRWGELFDKFIVSKPLSDRNRKVKEKVANELMPSIFEHILGEANPVVDGLDYDVFTQIKDLIMGLPSKSNKKYKSKSYSSIIKGIDKVKESEILSTTTVNSYLIVLKEIISYGQRVGLHNNSKVQGISTLTKIAPVRGERDSYSSKELEIMLSTLKGNALTLFKVGLYSGMRLSEVYKCEIREVDSVLCFDLTDVRLKLKNSHSYRVIPIHNKLLQILPQIKRMKKTLKQDTGSKLISRFSKEFLAKNSLTFHSLRHTAVTCMIQRGALHEIVSELLGHSQVGMTMSRYFKGYDISTLKENINLI